MAQAQILTFKRTINPRMVQMWDRFQYKSWAVKALCAQHYDHEAAAFIACQLRLEAKKIEEADGAPADVAYYLEVADTWYNFAEQLKASRERLRQVT